MCGKNIDFIFGTKLKMKWDRRPVWKYKMANIHSVVSWNTTKIAQIHWNRIVFTDQIIFSRSHWFKMSEINRIWLSGWKISTRKMSSTDIGIHPHLQKLPRLLLCYSYCLITNKAEEQWKIRGKIFNPRHRWNKKDTRSNKTKQKTPNLKLFLSNIYWKRKRKSNEKYTTKKRRFKPKSNSLVNFKVL